MPRKIIPFFAFEKAASGFWIRASPLFEKESNTFFLTPVAQAGCPRKFHRPSARTAFSYDNRPCNAREINSANRSKQRLKGYEARFGVYLSQMFYASFLHRVFNGYTEPNMRWHWCIRSTGDEALLSSLPIRKETTPNLEGVVE